MTARGWGSDPDIELHHPLLLWIVRHGISADNSFIDDRLQLEETEAFPVATILVPDIKVRIFDMVRRAFELHVATRPEIHVFSLGQSQRQFLDEGRHIGIGYHRTLPLLDAENLVRNLDLHILFDRSLAAQAPAFCGLPAIKMCFFGGQHRTPALGDDALALGAGAATAAR